MSEDPRESRQVRLSDLAAAAFLIAQGCHLAGVRPGVTHGRQEFVVEGEPRLISRLLEAYERGRAVVDLDAFLSAQRLLKDRLFRSGRTRS